SNRPAEDLRRSAGTGSISRGLRGLPDRLGSSAGQGRPSGLRVPASSASHTQEVRTQSSRTPALSAMLTLSRSEDEASRELHADTADGQGHYSINRDVVGGAIAW